MPQNQHSSPGGLLCLEYHRMGWNLSQCTPDHYHYCWRHKSHNFGRQRKKSRFCRQRNPSCEGESSPCGGCRKTAGGIAAGGQLLLLLLSPRAAHECGRVIILSPHLHHQINISLETILREGSRPRTNVSIHPYPSIIHSSIPHLNLHHINIVSPHQKV